MANFLLFLEYDGARYCGWQKQPGLRTVQGELAKAIYKVFHCRPDLTAAGRTDTGVHALGQGVSLELPDTVNPEKVCPALNAVLPYDIAVTSARPVPARFNARYSAVRKTYFYRIWNRHPRSVWAARAWHVRTPLDIAAMRTASQSLLGSHDFSAFAAAGGSQDNKVACMEAIRITRAGGFVTITCIGNRFLYKMVRNMVGTLVEVGLGRMKPEQVSDILKTGKRILAGPTAPPQGLFLKKVVFRQVS